MPGEGKEKKNTPCGRGETEEKRTEKLNNTRVFSRLLASDYFVGPIHGMG
jgi:hypothetical protein